MSAGDKSKKIEDVFAVTTRTAEKQKEEAEKYHRRERVCGVQPSSIGNCHTNDTYSVQNNVWMSELDEDLFSGGRMRITVEAREARGEEEERATSGSS